MSDSSWRSNPHRRVEKALQKMGVSYISENEDFPPYTLDLYLNDFHLCIEVDGPKHSTKKDTVRDQWILERYGIPTLRIKTKGSWQNQLKLEKEILAFLEEYADSYKERKMIYLTLHA